MRKLATRVVQAEQHAAELKSSWALMEGSSPSRKLR
jgi:hypothetical protein